MTRFNRGTIIKCTVTAIESYGAFVTCDDYYTGLIHISEISDQFVNNIKDYLKVGEVIYAEVLDVCEESGHVRLSIRNIVNYRKGNVKKQKIRETRSGFKTLSKKLPFWIEDSLKKHKFNKN